MGTIMKDAKIRVIIDIEQAKRVLSEAEKRLEETEKSRRQETRQKRDDERKARREGRGGSFGTGVAAGRLAGGLRGGLGMKAAGAVGAVVAGTMLAERAVPFYQGILEAQGPAAEKIRENFLKHIPGFTELVNEVPKVLVKARALRAELEAIGPGFMSAISAATDIELAGGKLDATGFGDLHSMFSGIGAMDRQIAAHKQRIRDRHFGRFTGRQAKGLAEDVVQHFLGGMNK